ncbi:MAG: aminotransferase class V-fold PLP-dependent enzyme [Anaerolineales bacterium]|nr:aminotransferase class V-fold PLP-dependent enzyme [Anaerolineales bacterium]
MDIEGFTKELQKTIKPYRQDHERYKQLPAVGHSRQEIVKEMEELFAREEPRWREGKVSGAVYHGDENHIEFQNQIYSINSQSNPLHFDVWPSATKFEAEIVSMTAHMLGAGLTQDEIVGTVSSGGTESIMLAMKTYRDWARDKKEIAEPEMIVPTTAHAAFDKASQYFNIKMIRIPVKDDFRADVEATRAAITGNTIVIVGSAPPFPHGIIDPIQELSELAQSHDIGFHTDACLGGFLLPWAEKLGYPVPPFDFRLPGVTSMSADTHKYGYAAKGTSVVLYRGREMRHYQYYVTTEWPGGLYFSPTFAGSRPGALSAACWAAMLSMGEQGYLNAARGILETAAKIKQGIKKIPGVKVLGDPLFVIAIASDDLDIYAVSDVMTQKGWSLNGLQLPPAIHIALTQRHSQPGLAEKFLQDLAESAAYVKAHPEMQGSMTPIYGMSGNVAFKGAVQEFIKQMIDMMFDV